MPSKRETPRNVSTNGKATLAVNKAKEQASIQKALTTAKQHEHDAPETRNVENRGRTANNRGK